VFNWPTDGKLVVPGLKNQPEKAYLLADPKQSPLSFVCGEAGVNIAVPQTAPDAISSTVVLRVKGPLEIEQQGIAQDYDGSIVLPASEARLHGDEIKYESGDRRDNIGFWTNPADWADWEVAVNKPGKFDVTAEVAAPEKATLEVSVGGQKTTGAVTVTGDYGRFRMVKMGTIEVNNTGKMGFALRAVQEGWHPVNVKAVRLKPAQ